MSKTPILQPMTPPQKGQCRHWYGLDTASSALAISEAAVSANAPVLLVAKDAEEADELIGAIKFFTHGTDLEVLSLPDWEVLPYDVFSPDQRIVSERLATFSRLPKLQRGILTLPVSALTQRLCPRGYVAATVFRLETHEPMPHQQFCQQLSQNGYLRVGEVLEQGEYAVRGSLIDVFPSGSTHAYRIDFLDDAVDSIRAFEPDSQRSIREVPKIALMPAREFPTDENSLRLVKRRMRSRFGQEVQRSFLYQEISQGRLPSGIESYLPLFFDQTENVLDYLPETTIIILPAYFDDILEQSWKQTAHRYEQHGLDRERPLLPPDELLYRPEVLRSMLNTRARIRLHDQEESEQAKKHYDIFNVISGPKLKLSGKGDETLEHYAAQNQSVLILTASVGEREIMQERLQTMGCTVSAIESWHDFITHKPALALARADIHQGFSIPDQQIALVGFDQWQDYTALTQKRSQAGRDPLSVIRNLNDLAIGDPVVHEQHGVGRYDGLSTFEIDGIRTECLIISYAGNDKLYVPVSALHKVGRYGGAPSEKAPWHSLGSDQWEKARRRAVEKIRDVAAELIEIQARRMEKKGFSMRANADEYQLFCQSFPFEETPDQRQTIQAVLDDLASPHPTDRVVCGDVGFGKTEVAMRAAFVAVMSGHQVAILVPTTLLAQQHYRNFRDRFAQWPVKIAQISRLDSGTKANTIQKNVAQGDIDIVIGTHKILQGNTHFKRLGLMIVDEEHRFGVRDKEKLKALRAEVDLLTLTATPIPRTLNMALGGLRELSIIATPPPGRLAIRTFIGSWNDALIEEACLREIQRGGQIYMVHNEVRSIENARQKLQQLMPGARIAIAHGQMREHELERVMLDFYHRRYNILVCTTIIESGIDIPTANTIIIERADRFGLAQLHQLRGRVGRSNHHAYAYLMIPENKKAMTADARKRLEALANLENLGSGFVLATHDMEIRGAGSLLGDEQSGHMMEIGFDLYNELLARTVEAMRHGELSINPETDKPKNLDIQLRLPALLPEDYIDDVKNRLVIYKRIAEAKNSRQLEELQIELIDRFGLLPQPARNLFALAEMKQKALSLGIVRIEATSQGLRIGFHPHTPIQAQHIMGLLKQKPELKMSASFDINWHCSFKDDAHRLEVTNEVLDLLLSALMNETKLAGNA